MPDSEIFTHHSNIVGQECRIAIAFPRGYEKSSTPYLVLHALDAVAGFSIERLAKPKPSDDLVQKYPALQDAQIVAYFLHVQVRKHPDS